MKSKNNIYWFSSYLDIQLLFKLFEFLLPVECGLLVFGMQLLRVAVAVHPKQPLEPLGQAALPGPALPRAALAPRDTQ